LEETYGVYMVLQANALPNPNEKMIAGYAAGSHPDVM
jgi:hypothetical protein